MVMVYGYGVWLWCVCMVMVYGYAVWCVAGANGKWCMYYMLYAVWFWFKHTTTAGVCDVSWTLDGSMLVSGGMDNTCKVCCVSWWYG